MRRLLLKLRRRARLEHDLEQELALHRELAAARGNHIALGSTLRIKEASRDLWRFGFLEDFGRDLRYGARSLVRQPGFTVFALLALALGIGLNVAVFTMFNGMALRPWAVRDPASLVLFDGDRFSRAEYQQLRAHARTFQDLALTVDAAPGIHVDGTDGPSQRVELVSGNYFDVVGVPMALGRGFGTWEDRTEAPAAVAVLAHSFWRSRFGADAGVLGREVRLNGVPFTIVGVTGRGFTGTYDRDMWVPAAALRLLIDPQEPIDQSEHCCGLIGRLRAGVTRSQAQADVSILERSLRAPADRSASWVPARLIGTSRIEAPIGRAMLLPFLIAQVAVGAIFLLACLNVANLTLARTIARDRELAVRMSLGASRGRVVRQLLSEGLLLTAAASVAILIVLPMPGWFAGMRGGTLTYAGPDFRVAAYAAAAALLATVVCGLIPAWQVTRPGLMESIKRQSAQATPRVPLHGLLLALQVAVSVVVLVCASLLARGVYHAARVDLGFSMTGLSAVWIQVRWNEFIERGIGDFVPRVRTALQPLGPVSVSDTAPMRALTRATAALPARRSRAGETAQVQEIYVDSAWFDVLGIPLVSGRVFVPQDKNRDVAIVNQTMARRYWGDDESPLGTTIGLDAPRIGFPIRPATRATRDHQVIGVVRDAHLTGIAEMAPTVFRVHQEADQAFTVIVPSRMAPAVETVARQMHPSVAVSVTNLSGLVEEELTAARYLAQLAGALAVIAVLLAATGVYGVFAHAVAGRRREIAIRIALGARAAAVIGGMVGRTGRPLLGGLAAGFVLAMLASNVLGSQLYGISRLDPLAYVAVLFVLLIAGTAASALPARRAARINPAEELSD
jgi:predicted permease